MLNSLFIYRNQRTTGNKDSTQHLAGVKQQHQQDIKTSLEQDKNYNKHKFEDPFFIKLAGDGDKRDSSMKIIKAGENTMHRSSSSKKRHFIQKGHDSNSDSESSDESTSKVKVKHGRSFENANDSTAKRLDAKFDKTSGNKTGKGNAGGKGDSAATVIEADEDEEQSPTLKANSSKKKIKQPQKGVIKEIDEDDKLSVDTKQSSIKTLPQLVQFDVNLDSLKNFLEDIQEAINDHAKSIQLMQQDLKRKAYEKTLGHYFLKISEGLHKECGERPHAFRLDNEPNYLQENFQTDDSTLLKRQAEKMLEKMEIIGLNIINFQKFRNETTDRIEKLERIIPKCFTIDQFREESQQQETRIIKYTNDQLGNFQENLNGYKRELSEALTSFHKRVNDNQAETVWRIKDCEELLKSRVSDKYVNDSLKALEDKIIKQLNYNEEKGIERLEKSFKELAQRVIQTNQFFNEKFEDLRKVISQYDSKITNMATLDKLFSIQSGQKDMKYNIERELEQLQEHVKETKDKISELSKRFSNLETAAANDNLGNYQPTSNLGIIQAMNHHVNASLNSIANNATAVGHNSSTNSNNATSRNASQFQSTTNAPDKKSQSSIHKNQKSPEHHQPSSPNISPLMRKRQGRADQALMAEIEKKMHYVDEQFFNVDSKIDSLKKQLDDKINKEDVRKLTSDKVTKEDLDHLIPNEEIMQEKMKYLIRDEIENLQAKMLEQTKQLDNKMIRLRAELDIHSIQRQLERKANEDQVRNDFSNHEFKISTLDRNIIRMATDFETFQLALNKLHSVIVELQDANRDVLLGKRTNNCLSCGKGGDTSQTVMGKDGRVYKGGFDHRGNGMAEGDVNIPGSQFMMYDGLSPMTGGGPGGAFHHNLSQLGEHPQSSQDHFQKIRPSNSFYETANAGSGGIYDNSGIMGLPSVHNKKTSMSNNFGLKNIHSQAGISSTGAFNTQLAGSQSAVNSSFTATSALNTKKKLPFGFQVQKEKKDLFKIGGLGNSQTRGKSSQAVIHGNGRPVSNRIEDFYQRGDSEQNIRRDGDERRLNFHHIQFET